MAALKLHHDAASRATKYRDASPFPHIVLGGLFDDTALDAVLREFPAPGEKQWRRFDNPLEKKLGYSHETATISNAWPRPASAFRMRRSVTLFPLIESGSKGESASILIEEPDSTQRHKAHKESL